ncbi:MAG TPA: FAD-binding oxidoreductase [Polyangiaceae bacterium]|jgi:decaprenylphospho-beta-D-ribofuranose 2-oxidase|nr:FAD-binding oxidoreductase [Polyangiaceae bacterium]
MSANRGPHVGGLHVHAGFGTALRSVSRVAKARSADDVAAIVEYARREGLTIAARGSGRSYGDAANLDRGLVLDMLGMNRVHDWNPIDGIMTCEPGLTIEGLWRRSLEDGYWPAVVPGTMAPTLGGCLSTNIHGKNNFAVGSFGEHVLDFELITAAGERLHCSRTSNTDVFHAVIGGMGLLGVVTKMRLKLGRVGSGYLHVRPLVGRSLDEMFDLFERHVPESNYLVGWMDCTVGGGSLGRGLIHRANYVSAEEDPTEGRSLNVERQVLPAKILGVPKALIWRLMRPWTNDFGVRIVNSAKYFASRMSRSKPYLQSHVAFAFLLDYIPNWKLAYGPGGLIQHQIFVPAATARVAFRDVLRLTQKRGFPSYLGVMKRHRPDPFLLTHALDGYSLALDFSVKDSTRAALWNVTAEMTDIVLAAGGNFYFAKDSVLRAGDVVAGYGSERLGQFFALKRKLDPESRFATELSRRVFVEPSPNLGANARSMLAENPCIGIDAASVRRDLGGA